VFGAWASEGSTRNSRGVWLYKRGKKVAELQMPLDLDEDVVQILVYGSWIVGCCATRIEVWSSTTYEHYTTLLAPFAGSNDGLVLTGGICYMPTYTNKIFAGREDGSVEIWNVSTGKLVYTIQPPSADAGAVSALQPTPALSLLAIAYTNGLVVIHDIHVDKEILRINAGKGGQSPITSITFRTDGLGAGDDGQDAGVMATASFNSGDVTIWDLNNGGRKMGSLRGAHNPPSDIEAGTGGGISKAEFLPGQAILMTSGVDNSLKSWIFDKTPFSPIPRILHSRSGHAASITTLSFLPTDADGADAGGKWLLSASRDNSLWGWSLRRDGQSTEISQGNVQKKAKELGALSSNHASEPDRGATLASLKAPPITSLACSLNRDGGMGAMPGVKALWANAKQLKGKSTATEQNITGWESMVTAHEGDKYARTWFWGRKRAGRWLLETGDGSEVKTVTMSPCGTFAIIGSALGGIDMYNLQSGLHRQRFPAKLTPAQARALQEQQTKGVVATTASVKKYSRGQGRHTKSITGLHVDNLNRTVVSSSTEGTLKFWDFTTSTLVDQLSFSSFTITKFVAHRASDLLALSCTDNTIRILDLNTRRIVRELTGSSSSITDVCFSPDGRWIIAACAAPDSTIRVWDLPTGHMIDAIRTTSPCTALAFSNTAEFLAVALEGSVGIDIWTNRTLFSHIPTRAIDPADITLISGPTASGEGGSSVLAGALADDPEADTEAENPDATSMPSLDQLSTAVTTLSLVPRSRWQTLLHLDLIRARNKPKEAPKAPEKAPFFLPAMVKSRKEDLKGVREVVPLSLEQRLGGEEEGAGGGPMSRLMRFDADAAAAGRGSLFSQLLRRGVDAFGDTDGHEHVVDGRYAPLITHLKSLNPAAADIEIRSLQPTAPYTELVAFVDALTERLEKKRDYEVVQAWMAVFLRVHGEVLQEAVVAARLEGGEMSVEEVAGGKMLVESVKRWRRSAETERERLGQLVGYCTGVVGWLRSAR